MDSASIIGYIRQVPLDWLVIGTAILLLTFISLRSGTRVAVSAGLAGSMSLVLLALAPQALFLESFKERLVTDDLIQAGAFCVFFIITFLMIARMTSSDALEGQPLSAIVAALAALIIIITIWINTPALGRFWDFGPHVRMLFAEGYRFWLIIVALIALTFVRS